MRDSQPSVGTTKRGYVPVYGVDMPIALFVLNLGITILPIWWAISHRSLDDFLRYSPYLGLPVFLFSARFIFRLMKMLWEHKQIGFVIFLVTEIPFGICTVGSLIYCFIASAWDLLSWLYSVSGTSQFAAFALMLSTFLSGLVLFAFRLRFRATYGMTEAVAGVCIAGYKFMSDGANAALTNPNFYLALLTAGVYLVVRGLDNVHQGLYKDPIDPIPGYLTKLFRIPDSKSEEQKADSMDSHQKPS